MRSEHRDRDVLGALPFLPSRFVGGFKPCVVGSLPLSQAVLLTNRTLAASNAMWLGSLKDAQLWGQHGCEKLWTSATPLQKKLATKIFEKHVAALLSGRRLDSEGSQALAFERICKAPVADYEGSPLSTYHDTLPKGALCPLVVAELSVPPRGSRPVDPCDFSTALHRYYQDAERLMARPDLAVDWEAYRDIRPYSDPALQDDATVQKLLGRLFDAGMLGAAEKCEETLALFAVIKKDPPPGEAQSRSTRIVWDLRRTNLRFHQPPKMPLGSAASLSFLDLSPEWLGSDARAVSFTGDLPDWFCRILPPPALSKFFVFQGWTWERLRPLLAAEGRCVQEVSDFHGHVCLAVLPMGWSWALFCAHVLTLDVVEKALEGSGSQRLVDGQPTPHIQEHSPVH